MKKRFFIAILVCIFTVIAFPGVGGAKTPTSKGLAISPPRNFVSVDAGKTVENSVIITNYTQADFTVSLSVEEFSVNNYSYSYIFKDAKENWLHFSQTAVQLQPNKSQKIAYTLTPPANAEPGGKYYTIVASSDIKQGSVSSKMQVATPLYITVKGDTTQTNKLEGSKLTQFVTGDHIPFSLDINNTGNVHYTVTITGSLSGLWTNRSNVATTHILLPHSIRHIDESIPTPLLPGIYKASYGYRTDTSKPVLVESFVVYTPLWFYAALALAGWGTTIFVRYIKNKKRVGLRL